ncbi:MAG: VWA domain-containing protein [Myxococcaceae bacterium]|nr:VWA domain-containing protein [Myxococcaceae bacterium]
MLWTAWAVETRNAEQREGHLLIQGRGADDEPRAPVMVNLVLDRSGSMKGAPLAAAVEAAQSFIDLAGPDDYIGLVLFDGVAEQRVPVTAMDVRGKALMAEAFAHVTTGRGTALHQAIEVGARGLQRTLVPGRRPRLLLLTDGEPSVGADTQDAFDELGLRLARMNLSVHALGLARHYVAEVLEALTRPSGNGFEHVDGPEGLTEAMGAIVSTLFGQVASEVQVRVQPEGLGAISCRHGFPTALEADALVITLGDVSRGFSRRVLLSGPIRGQTWSAIVHGSCRERGDVKHQKVEVEFVTPESSRGRLIVGLSHELNLVTDESAAWLSLARRDTARAETQLEAAETALRAIVAMAPEGIPVRRHLERLADLRSAVERGEGDIPLLIRRAQAARAGTNVSQVIPIQNYQQRRK